MQDNEKQKQKINMSTMSVQDVIFDTYFELFNSSLFRIYEMQRTQKIKLLSLNLTDKTFRFKQTIKTYYIKKFHYFNLNKKSIKHLQESIKYFLHQNKGYWLMTQISISHYYTTALTIFTSYINGFLITKLLKKLKRDYFNAIAESDS